MVQTDMKKLVAYSSVAHMGYVVMGMFTINEIGISGSVYQMLNHGVSTGALFLLVGMIYDRTHNRKIADYGGLAKIMPIFTIVFFIVTMSSIAVPGTNGFIGEYLILMGTFLAHPVIGVFAATGVVLGAVYMLWLFKRVFLGSISDYLSQQQTAGVLKDLNIRESAIMFSLVLLIFWMGIFPNHFMKYSKTSVKHLTDNAATYYLETNEVEKVSSVDKGAM
jgi:NADH-quinone oxidoreductase subunit M